MGEWQMGGLRCLYSSSQAVQAIESTGMLLVRKSSGARTALLPIPTMQFSPTAYWKPSVSSSSAIGTSASHCCKKELHPEALWDLWST
ncbi:hypothetical protein PF005_g308 [Phytophthora fragariae]|uniref:Uncharacterized protein n=1 Tax=Phytophthora fragariae TaxID=53985 RepID=A0A6A3KA04_9STRA|nr:hypothetical protein PF011_g13306 [Phytophthora fragariae]KAE9136715.1 hypothetical protein PF010_g1598 [Phytophthora fragariae]KAE9141383.1 hypothetical protein PF007_g256 [Phytophthora fragariae]KAE9238325.1 hypothetical protein PF005_g308 [Phytophthora fragariae]KAE9258280.1 hypothetical protein PF002_g250 [Phytophthora fragariae]